MANQFLTPQVIGREAVRVLINKMPLLALCYRDYEAEYRAAKIGDTIQIRTPASLISKEFNPVTGIEIQDIKQGNTQLVLEKHKDVSVQVSSKDLTLSLNDFSTHVVEPAMVALAEDAESYIASKAVGIPNMIGTAFPTTLGNVAMIDAYLDVLKVPAENRWGVLSSMRKASMLSIDKITTADVRGDNDAIINAQIGRILGVNYLSSPLIQRQTAGTLSTTALLVNGALVAGATTGAFDAAAVTGGVVPGNTFTITGVTLQDGVTPMNFVVTAVAAAAGNAITVNFLPALPVAVADNVATTWNIAAHAMNIVGDFKGIAFASIPLDAPLGNSAQSEIINYRGISVRVVMDYDHTYKQNKISFDMLMGAKVIDPRILARIPG